MKFFFSKYNTALATFLNKPTPDRYEWSLIIALTVFVTLFLHGSALNGYWRFDDGAHLMFATEYSPWQYFFDPEITRAQSGSNVTPWNVFFYDFNLSLFGFSPTGFYAHLLVLLTGSALALYALLRLWLPLPSAAFGLILFLAGKPTYHLSQELMSNHYLTGMLFSLLSLNFFVHYIRYGNNTRLLFSVVLYVLAMACKEVYVPLIALFFVMPTGSFRQRMIAIFPFILVIIGYALWRHEVLGAWVGGYTPKTAEVNYWMVVQQLLNIPFVLFDNHGWGLAQLIIVTIMSLMAVWNRLLNIPLLLTAVFILFAPLIPLTLFRGISQPDRYLFAPWTATSIWIAIIFQSLRNSTESEYLLQPTFIAKSLSALALIIASFLGHINEKQRNKDIINKAEDIYRFAIEADFSQKALILDVNDGGDYWAFVSSEARRTHDNSNNIIPHPALVTVNTLNGMLLLGEMTQDKQLDYSAIQFYGYHNGRFKLINIKPTINSLLKSLKAGKDQMLQVTFSHKQEALLWEFQPKAIAYSAIIWQGKPGLQYPILELSEKGSYPWSKKDEIQISLSFQSPKGWIAITPKFKFDPGQQALTWQGKTELDLITNKLESLLFRFAH